MKFRSFFSVLIITFLTFSFTFAQTVLYVQKTDGEFIEKITFNENSLGDSLRINFYCSYVSFFKSKKCVSEKSYEYLNSININNNVSVDTNSAKLALDTTANDVTPSTQVVYQVIERAVPGPQGPAGRDGVDGRDFSNSTIASFFPNTAIGGQYMGYGSGNGGSSANPTGSGNLSSLNVSGDSTFGGKITGSGLVACNTVTDKLAYNSTTGQFECNVDQGGGFSGGNLTGQILTATVSMITPVLYASTTYFSTSSASTSFTTDLNGTYATITNATSTNFYTTNLVSSGLFGLATGTIASATISNLNTEDLFSNKATFSYATVTNGFFTNLSVSGPITAALTNGFVFRGGTNNFSEATSSIFIDNSSNIGIGTSTSLSARVNVSGTVKFSSYSSAGANLITDLQGNLFISSDERLKNVQGEFSKGLAELKNIKPVYYKWNELSGLDKENTYTGFIAQNVADNIPEAVSVGGNGYLSLADRPIIASLVNAVKELSNNLESYLSRLVNLENKQAELENKVNVLQQRLDTVQGIVTPPPSNPDNWVEDIASSTASTTVTTQPQNPENIIENITGNVPENVPENTTSSTTEVGPEPH